MPRIKFTVAYDGTDFCGWQRQNHGPKPSVSQTIEEGLSKIFNQKVSLYASGRTDAGVHALNQVCHFDVTREESRIIDMDLKQAMRTQLPKTITLKRVWLAPADFHSTISPEKKTYRYVVNNSMQYSPFLNRYSDWLRKPLDLNLMNEYSKYILGQHDFKSFQSVGSPVPHTIRLIESAEWGWRRENIAYFTITGSGFLKQMVRNIVGTELLLFRKDEKPTKMKEILDFRDRTQAGPPAPAQGLFLMRVYYPQDLDNKCREL